MPGDDFLTQVRFSSASAIYTVPTGLPSLLSGPGDAGNAHAEIRLPYRRAPTAIEQATSGLTAPYFSRSSSGTPST